MKYIGAFLLFLIAIFFVWMGYIILSVFSLLRWPVFIIVCLFWVKFTIVFVNGCVHTAPNNF